MNEDNSSDGTILFRPSTRTFLLKSASGWLFLLLSIPGFIVTLPLLAFWALRNRTTQYRIEGDRLFMRKGIVLRSEDEIELYRVKDIKANFSIVQQMFNAGDLSIISTDFTGQRVQGTRRFANSYEIRHVDDARTIREVLRTRVERMRRRTRTREID